MIDRKPHLDSLDLIRGIAALLVLSEHLRAYVFQNFETVQAKLNQPALIVKAFYFLTGLGHEAVMIFFALSGFLVGGKTLDDMLRGRFSWSRYILRRLTRLWIVILPALMLTFVFYEIGINYGSVSGYDGSYYHFYSSGPRSPDGDDYSLAALAGNLTFLQTILVPTYGSNGPIWSLANEFWYYIIFPLFAWLCLGRAPFLGKLIGASILLGLVVFLPGWLLINGGIWVAGAAAAWVSRKPMLGWLRAPGARLVAVTVFATALLLTKSPVLNLGDLGLGIAIAFTLPVIANLPSFSGWAKIAARASSEGSFTLYLTHFPFLTLIVMIGLAPARWSPGVIAAAIYSLLFVAAILWAAVVWWCFERNTDRAYFALESRLPHMRLLPRRPKAI